MKSNFSNNLQFNNKYEQIKLLGEGSFGKAFLVECLEDNSLAVIKTIELGAMSKEEKNDALLESKILEQLNHPNIIRFREVLLEDKKSRLNIVMDYADGGDLQQKIKLYQKNTRYFTETQILDWFTQTCLAIKHIHDRKILHRDIKSQNIFLTKNGLVKLGDFGIAKCLDLTIDKVKTIVGTPYYLSPELLQNKPYSFKNDIWALGVLLYEMCALKMPFEAPNLPILSLKIIRCNYNPISDRYSKDLKNLISLCLNIDPIKRPSVKEILNYPLVSTRIKKFLSEIEFTDEFSHTIMHKYNVLKHPSIIEQRLNNVNINNAHRINAANKKCYNYENIYKAQKPIIKKDNDLYLKDKFNNNYKKHGIILDNKEANSNNLVSPPNNINVNNSTPNINNPSNNLITSSNENNKNYNLVKKSSKDKKIEKIKTSVINNNTPGVKSSQLDNDSKKKLREKSNYRQNIDKIIESKEVNINNSNCNLKKNLVNKRDNTNITNSTRDVNNTNNSNYKRSDSKGSGATNDVEEKPDFSRFLKDMNARVCKNNYNLGVNNNIYNKINNVKDKEINLNNYPKLKEMYKEKEDKRNVNTNNNNIKNSKNVLKFDSKDKDLKMLQNNDLSNINKSVNLIENNVIDNNININYKIANSNFYNQKEDLNNNNMYINTCENNYSNCNYNNYNNKLIPDRDYLEALNMCAIMKELEYESKSDEEENPYFYNEKINNSNYVKNTCNDKHIKVSKVKDNKYSKKNNEEDPQTFHDNLIKEFDGISQDMIVCDKSDENSCNNENINIKTSNYLTLKEKLITVLGKENFDCIYDFLKENLNDNIVDYNYNLLKKSLSKKLLSISFNKEYVKEVSESKSSIANEFDYDNLNPVLSNNLSSCIEKIPDVYTLVLIDRSN